MRLLLQDLLRASKEINYNVFGSSSVTSDISNKKLFSEQGDDDIFKYHRENCVPAMLDLAFKFLLRLREADDDVDEGLRCRLWPWGKGWPRGSDYIMHYYLYYIDKAYSGKIISSPWVLSSASSTRPYYTKHSVKAS